MESFDSRTAGFEIHLRGSFWKYLLLIAPFPAIAAILGWLSHPQMPLEIHAMLWGLVALMAVGSAAKLSLLWINVIIDTEGIRHAIFYRWTGRKIAWDEIGNVCRGFITNSVSRSFGWGMFGTRWLWLPPCWLMAHREDVEEDAALLLKDQSLPEAARMVLSLYVRR